VLSDRMVLVLIRGPASLVLLEVIVPSIIRVSHAPAALIGGEQAIELVVRTAGDC